MFMFQSRHINKHIILAHLDQHTGECDAQTSSTDVCILGVDEFNAIDEPLIETRPFHSGEKKLPLLPAKCFLSVKWLAAMGELY